MTQSGQGEEPSARPAREGIVLPSDGGEPLLPGMTGGPVPQPAPQPPAGPSGGQAWDRQWGPEHQQAPQYDPAWPEAPAQQAQQWSAPEQPGAWTDQTPGSAGAGPLPPEGAPAPAYGGQTPDHQGYGPGGPAAQNPAYGFGAPASQPSYGQAGPGPQGAPMPPVAEAATQYLPPVPPAAPADEGATQYLPPVTAGPAPADEGATQYMPPVTSGALPPEAGEQTRYLGGPVQQPAAAGADAEATQYIPPYTGAFGGDRQPPSEFDNLFRGGPGGEGPAGATQQMPRFQEPPGAHPGQPQPAYAPQDQGGGRGGRTRSRVPLIAAVGVGIAVLGIGAGALLGGGGGGGGGGDRNKNVAASAPATEDSKSAADPARQQAVALDKLLADSGNSRSSVINAVADVRACNNLDGAASDLRDAAKQRSGLVTSLSKLAVDKLPNHADLTSALTKAWQASAAADSHYAAWADQVSGKKGCKKGQARSTGQTAAGNRASGAASTQKVRAAALWNAIAKTYGLTQRQPTQL
ncbi:hypothetical protein ACFY0F_35610 [Streptomyces sp. NPDC001544]|uniref:hypothetical protein n=1 Tax=Streptomyces sp. NPDC001544 TaxID=3364584 RepID=UPI0036A86F9A